MQYFVVSLLTLLGLANSSQCAEVNGGHNTWSSGPRVRLEVNPRIEEWPHSGPGKKLVLHKKNEPLNMTCTVVYQNGEKDDETPFDYTVDWKGPRHVNNNPKIERGQSRNTAWIWFERLAEKDAGDYTCMAVSHKPWGHQTTLSVFFYLFVEHKPTYCGSQWFRCRSKNCIMERYVCDGKPDCEEGEDESLAAGCGPDPCLGKVLCEDRCIPPEWCCDHRNCSGTFGLRPWPHENHEISYVQTAFYTVIGCAMAFMFIVTILVIAICRVQIKRAMNSRCSQQNRNVICGRRAVPLYDLDVYLNRTADVNYPGGVSIMYNINSGVQFVGRPTEPPPYSEVMAEPPREGPPPPYVSCENLIVRVPNPRFHENPERIEINDEPEASNVPLNRSVNVTTGAEQSDTDVRIVTSIEDRENSVSNIPGPQVPTYTCLSRGQTNIERDNERTSFSRLNAVTESLDNVDSPIISMETSRIQRTANYELEYVETDALLADNSNDRVATTQRVITKESTIAWKPYSRHALVKSRWLNNERRDKRNDKNWYRQTFDKTIKDCQLRETSSHKDSENEGVFLDTDQQDTTPIESSSSSSSSGDNEIPNGFTSFANIVDATTTMLTATTTTTTTTTTMMTATTTTTTTKPKTTSRQTNDENIASSSCANSTASNETASCLTIVDNEQGETRIKELLENPETRVEQRRKRTELKFLRENKSKSEIAGTTKKSTSGKHFLRGMKRQSSLTNEEIVGKNLNVSTARASTGSVDLPNPRLDDNATDSRVRQSSLVLPLRESFIGVQRDS